MLYETEDNNSYKTSVKNLEKLLHNTKAFLNEKDIKLLEESIFILKIQPQFEPTLLLVH